MFRPSFTCTAALAFCLASASAHAQEAAPEPIPSPADDGRSLEGRSTLPADIAAAGGIIALVGYAPAFVVGGVVAVLTENTERTEVGEGLTGLLVPVGGPFIAGRALDAGPEVWAVLVSMAGVQAAGITIGIAGLVANRKVDTNQIGQLQVLPSASPRGDARLDLRWSF